MVWTRTGMMFFVSFMTPFYHNLVKLYIATVWLCLLSLGSVLWFTTWVPPSACLSSVELVRGQNNSGNCFKDFISVCKHPLTHKVSLVETGLLTRVSFTHLIPFPPPPSLPAWEAVAKTSRFPPEGMWADQMWREVPRWETWKPCIRWSIGW